jgi:ABC-type Mn2+/Zn2+ transport system permease subunit
MRIEQRQMLADTSSPELLPAMLTGCSMAVACAILSVFVVTRRWAFIGEGISHSGFGGAGTVWLLMLAFPVLERQPWVAYVGVVVFCLATAIAIGYFTRTGRINSDAAIGIFMVASLAWGFLAQQIYHHQRGFDPANWPTYLFGRMDVSVGFAIVAAGLCAAVVAVVVFLSKEIVAYCFDPVTAEAAGVRVGFIHYLLMVLISLTIAISVRVVGSVLVTALLVLPGATALLLSKRLATTITLALVAGLVGTLGGLTAHFTRTFIPEGPAIVLVLFVEFLGAYLWAKVARA